MSLKVIEYDPRYLEGFLYVGEERKFFGSDEEVRKAIDLKAQREGRAIIGRVLGEVIFFAGIYEISSQVGEAWVFINPPASRGLLFSACKAISKEMHSTAKRMNLVRLQATCLPLKKAMRFSELMGFRLEAVLCKAYRGDLDILVYSIIWRERCQDWK